MIEREGVHTCRNVGVKYSAVLQGTCVPTAHSIALLWKVCLVSFFQHSLFKFGRTLKNPMIQDDYKIIKIRYTVG